MSQNNTLVTRVDECLPQTQCTQCGYPRCLDYARAVVERESDINRCPPGGDVTLNALATITGDQFKPLDPELRPYPGRLVVQIREAECIGCVLCIKACPVDAIVGAAKLMHTVITTECTGCELCIEPCPMDCIDLVLVQNETSGTWPQFSDAEVMQFRCRAEQHFARTSNRQRSKTQNESSNEQTTSGEIDRQQIIKNAVARTRARRSSNNVSA
ncbi:MAG: RnfABCDGE type electron transport complex subunit B [Gammaproteobacteria bacterium]|nr:RnfABCDGE type electron transport complex subunit B [Gammaproteobacteria bacterium]